MPALAEPEDVRAHLVAAARAGMALTYAPDSPAAGIGAGPGTTFSLSETRRIRFYERNYYDHPGFGVIALVTPAQGARPAGR